MLELWSILAAFFIVTVSPGPANIAVSAVAMSSGRKAGLLIGFGLSLGLGFWGLVAASGMGAVLQSSEIVLIAMKLAGGLYLLWLAFLSGRASLEQNFKVSGNTSTSGRWLYRGLLLNLSNPKAVVAWMAALSMGMGINNQSMDVAIATLCCILLGILNYTAYALAFSMPGFMALYQRFRRWIEGVVASLFAIAGFALIRNALSR